MANIVNTAMFKLKKYSPELMLVGGIVCMVSSTVLACRSTLKAKEVLDKHHSDMEIVELAFKENPEDYSEKDKNRDTAVVHIQTGVKLLKLYAGPIILGVIGTGLLCGNYYIMRKRNLVLMATLKGVCDEYSKYRKVIREKLGDEEEHKLKAEMYKEKVEQLEQGVQVHDREFSIYSRFFDEWNPNWQKDKQMNLVFLKNVQKQMNDLLDLRGYVFLNDVYNALGFESSKPGTIVGWSKKLDPDVRIDFGVFNDVEQLRDFMMSWERCVILDFNVQGVIYDLL